MKKGIFCKWYTAYFRDCTAACRHCAVAGSVRWHETARPQVHGYDMAALAPLSATAFASAAEEKVIRVFQAPHNFLQNFHNIVGEKLVEEETGGELFLLFSTFIKQICIDFNVE